MRLIAIAVYCVLLIFSFAGCEEKRRDTALLRYIAYSNRDSAQLELDLFESRFHGKLRFYRPGGEIDSGEVRGDIKNDTLAGDYYYTPFGWGQKKRRPFILLKKGAQYILGTGTEQVYMGIPHYIPSTISFQRAKFIFSSVDH